DNGVGRQYARFSAALDGDLDAFDHVDADEPAHLGVDNDIHRQGLYPSDRAGVRAELVPPVDQRHRLRKRLQRKRPVERRVATAHDYHVLPGELVEMRYEVDDPLAGPAVGGRQRSSREAAHATRDEDRSTVEQLAVRECQQWTVVHIGQLLGALAQAVRGIEL